MRILSIRVTGSSTGSYSAGITHVEHQEQCLPRHKGSTLGMLFSSHSLFCLLLYLLLLLSLIAVVTEMIWAIMEKSVGKDGVKNGKRLVATGMGITDEDKHGIEAQQPYQEKKKLWTSSQSSGHTHIHLYTSACSGLILC